MSETKSLTKWNLNDLLPAADADSVDKILKEVSEKVGEFVAKWKEREDYLIEPSVMKEALDDYESLVANYGTSGNAGYYFSLKALLDQSNVETKVFSGKISDVSVKLDNDLEFFTNKISKITKENQEKFLNSDLLADYKHFVEHLFNVGKYTLSENEENILSLTSISSYENWVKMRSEFLSKEQREVLNDQKILEKKSFPEIMSLLDNPDKEIRDCAAAAFNDILEKNSDVAENEMNSVLHIKRAWDDIRGLKRPDDMRFMEDDIDADVVDNLVDAVSSDFKTPQKFYELKAKLLGLEKLQYHERNLTYGGIYKKYSFDESIEIFSNVLKKLDTEFLDIFNGFLENGRIDVFPSVGKVEGALCSMGQKYQPVYILLNHTGTLDDVTTLAHESGHGINFELIKKNQNALNMGTPLCMDEVASTFFEDFILDELSKDLTDEEKLTMNMMRLGDIIPTIHRQIACYKFEHQLHDEFRGKGYLSKSEIGEMFKSNMSAYMGAAVEQSAGSENWWIYWSHIRSFFYVYTYASGLLISRYMHAKVLEDPNFIEKVKVFLGSGSSLSPLEVFEKLGINIKDKSFWEKGLEEVSSLLDETTELAKKLGKI